MTSLRGIIRFTEKPNMIVLGTQIYTNGCTFSLFQSVFSFTLVGFKNGQQYVFVSILGQFLSGHWI